jgi:cbb3-type cytochrome oxidase subunit 1
MVWAYWLLSSGVVIMVINLTIAGMVEARLWQSNAPWLDSVRAARPFWIGRTHSSLLIVAGFIAFLLGLTTGPRGAGLAEGEESVGLETIDEMARRLTYSDAPSPRASRWPGVSS